MELFLLSLFIGTVLTSSVPYKSYKDYKYYEIEGDLEVLKTLDRKLMKYDDGSVISEPKAYGMELLIAPELVKDFEEVTKDMHLKIKLMHDDFSLLINHNSKRSLNETKGFWTEYHDIDEINQYLQNVTKTYPETTKLLVGGKTYEGRQIIGLRIIPEKNTTLRPTVFIESGIHAREWIAPATTTYFINQLLTSQNPDIQKLRNSYDWQIFPVTNPDGYHYTFPANGDRFWRKTRSKSPTSSCIGTDPNRNWDHNWGQDGTTTDPCDNQYGGTKPFSEIETRSLADYVSKVENLLAYISFHSHAQMLLVPYCDSTEHHDNYDDLVRIGKTSLEYGFKVNGAKYAGPGTAAEMLYSASGVSMDWVRQELGTKLVFTYELRGNMFQWPPELIYQQGDEVTQMLLGLFTEAEKLGYG